MKNIILPIIYVSSLVMLISFATSCSSANYVYNYNQKFHKQYKDNCPTFKNKYTNGLEW